MIYFLLLQRGTRDGLQSPGSLPTRATGTPQTRTRSPGYPARVRGPQCLGLGEWGYAAGCARCTWTRAGANHRPLPLQARARLQFFVSAALRSLSVLDWVGWGKPEEANQRLGLEKCLEGWTFSLETLAHLERTSLHAQRPSPPRPPPPPPPPRPTPYLLTSPS